MLSGDTVLNPKSSNTCGDSQGCRASPSLLLWTPLSPPPSCCGPHCFPHPPVVDPTVSPILLLWTPLSTPPSCCGPHCLPHRPRTAPCRAISYCENERSSRKPLCRRSPCLLGTSSSSSCHRSSCSKSYTSSSSSSCHRSSCSKSYTSSSCSKSYTSSSCSKSYTRSSCSKSSSSEPLQAHNSDRKKCVICSKIFRFIGVFP
ncbi:hypothetical protein FHG87_023900 [Trinorchestia longiramus]|nr:hypothetical protein FHG87_023900 [Trinorchestia longiramus]